MSFKKFAIVIYLYFLSTNILFSIEPDIFVQSTVNRASKILSDKLSKEQKINQLKKVAEETEILREQDFIPWVQQEKT